MSEIERITNGYIGAVKPWNTERGIGYSFRQTDSEEDIANCLSCPYEECDNCIEKRRAKKYRQSKGGKVGAPFVTSVEAVKALIEQGKTSKQVCAELSISRSTFFRYKAQIM